MVLMELALSTVANRAFPVDARTWNDLPSDVTSVESLSTFHQRLKTHLFWSHFLDFSWFFTDLPDPGHWL